MQLITDQDINKNHGKPMVVALGSFDGVHHGHRIIIEETVRQAKDKDALSGVFTFYPHPLKILAPEKAPGLITALSQKKEILGQLGLDRFILKSFTKEFASTNFRTFVEEYLVNYLDVRGVVIGEDFRFGKGSMGDAEGMVRLGEEYGFTVTIFDTLRVEGVEVRSTLIRNLITSGQVDKVQDYLKRPYSLLGKVVHGDGRGNKIGFPTANLSPAVDYVIPEHGVYVGYSKIKGERYPSVINIGVRPTFAKKELSIEIHILDFSDNLYGDILEVELIDRIRPETNFASVEDLMAQIDKDIAKARQILEKRAD